MTGRFRTPAGGRISRDVPVAFTFDGRRLTGAKGDTLAAALLANGIHLVGRSFKYHRPRGILSAGSEEPNALVTVSRDRARTTPNLRATQVELYEGLAATSQNRWPTLGFDLGAINDRLGRFLPAGFYYKTFMWPQSFWHRHYEPKIRAAAGLGKAPGQPDPDRYQNRFAHCDVLVIGAGPAGLAAAVAAMEAGARVIVADEQAEFGGSLLADPHGRIEGRPAGQWLTESVMALGLSDRVTCLPRTTAFGYFADNFVGLAERVTDHLPNPPETWPRERLWQVRAKQVVLATGAIERPLVFPGNDRPGIMLADAARTYLNRYGVRVGTRVAIATACDSAYLAALDLQAAGVKVAAIADMRAEGGLLTESVRQMGIPVETGVTVTGTTGRKRVSGVRFGRIDGRRVRTTSFACDALLMSGGWTPSVHLFSQSRGKLRFDEARGLFLPGVAAEAQISAGACNGTFELAAVLDEGYAAGDKAAAAACGKPARATRGFAVEGATPPAGHLLGALPQRKGRSMAKAFVDFQNDSTAADIGLAVREGFRSIEHVKRYTTTGMATDQGKTSNMNALGIAAAALGKTVPEVGLTTFRMPFTPTTFGSFAGVARGDLFDPVRRTPLHAELAKRGAVFEDVGQWKRAWYFPRAGETMRDAVDGECRMVRGSVGLFDASTLGKIEVVGRDAAEFLDRMYVNDIAGLPVGRCRYAVMTRDDGFVFDDGIVARLAPDRFHVTTTTGGAARVVAHMEDYLQTEWPNLTCWLTSLTEQWAVIAVQGPNSRAVIEPLLRGIDVSKAAMPHMSVREGRIGGVPCRLFRVSFTGELGYEINVPAGYARAVYEVVMREAERYGGGPYGTEAMHVLRAEKGYIVVGQDTDGTVTPAEAGLGRMVSRKKPDFVGKRGLARAGLKAEGRKELVGLKPADPSIVLEEGAQIVLEPDPPPRTHAIGHVTSSYLSPTLGHSIALAMVEAGRSRIGFTLNVPMPGRSIPVTVVDPVFHDPTGARLDP